MGFTLSLHLYSDQTKYSIEGACYKRCFGSKSQFNHYNDNRQARDSLAPFQSLWYYTTEGKAPDFLLHSPNLQPQGYRDGYYTSFAALCFC